MGSEASLAELERLSFVPPGECALQPRFGARIVCSNARALLVDRFEVTRASWRTWYEGAAERDPVFDRSLAQWALETGDWPASFMTLPEARSFATSRGMRLLTASEWMRVACGTRALPYPWGWTEASSVANTLNLGVRHPLPVGTFEQGRTSFSTYDMAGNVWEWVEEPIAASQGDGSLGLAWAMGGSYLSRLRRLHELDIEDHFSIHEQDLDPSSRSIDVGLRCCADAEEYLWVHAALWSSASVRDRLVAVGAAWGRDAIPLLEDLSRRPGAPAGLALLLEGARR
jgi:hypothetical protein